MPLERGASSKLTFGLLLIGASALSGSGTIAAVVGGAAASAVSGVGVNWVSEAVGSVVGAGPPPDEALREAFRRAVQAAVKELRQAYTDERVRRDGADAFKLLREVAREARVTEVPQGATEIIAVQRGLADALGQLLHGFPEPQVQHVRERLLPATARAFQSELANDPQAWRLYHSWVLERLLRQSTALKAALSERPAARAELADAAALEDRLDEVERRLVALLEGLREELLRAAREQAESGAADDRQIAEVGHDGRIENLEQHEEGGTGRVEQVQRTGDRGVISGGKQVSIRRRHTGDQQITRDPPAVVSAAPSASRSGPTALSLALRLTPTATGATITWEGDAVGSHTSAFVSPFPGADLDIVLRALDHLQHPSSPLDAAEIARIAALGLPTAGDMIADDLHQAVGRRLFSALTSEPAAVRALSSARDAAARAGLPLSLSLHLPQGAVALAALPWELLWAQDEPTPLLLSRGPAARLIRHLDLAHAIPAPRQGGRPLRVLAIAPHAGIDQADRDSERAARQQAWSALTARGDVALQPDLSPATPGALADALRAQRGQLDVLHFVGHGKYQNGEGYLVLDGAAGEWLPTPVSQIAPAIGTASARLAVLASCQSAVIGAEPLAAGLLGGVAPALVAHGVPLVVAMQLTIRADAAHAATRVIYEQLAAGQSVPAAVAAARLHLWTSERDRTSWYVPTLYVRARQVGDEGFL